MNQTCEVCGHEIVGPGHVCLVALGFHGAAKPGYQAARPPLSVSTINRFCVSVSGGKNPRVFKTMSFGYEGITPEEALVVAAWLVTLAETFSRHTFEEVLAKVRES